MSTTTSRAGSPTQALIDNDSQESQVGVNTATSSASSALATAIVVTPQPIPISPESILTRLKSNDNGYYVAHPNLASLADFYIGGKKGNVAIARGGTSPSEDAPTELLLRGLFEIDRRNFYLTPDGGFDPSNNPFNTSFADVKLTARLLPVSRDSGFSFSVADFPRAVENLRALETKAPKERGDEVTSIVATGGGYSSIRTVHQLFERIESGADDDDNEGEDGDSDASPVDPDFDIANWPVQDRNRDALAAIANSHRAVPLPAYDENHKLIAPAHYERKLAGAIAEVYFAFVHHRIGRKKKSVFSAVIREIIVVRPPSAAPRSPVKRRNLADGPSNAAKRIRAL